MCRSQEVLHGHVHANALENDRGSYGHVALRVNCQISSGSWVRDQPTMQECDCDNVERESHTSHNQHQFWVFHSFDGDEPLNGLEEDARSEGK